MPVQAEVQADPRLVAAVTAALAVCLGTSPESLRVRRIEPVPAGGPGAAYGSAASPAAGWPGPWAMAGRQAQMAGRHLTARMRKEGRR